MKSKIFKITGVTLALVLTFTVGAAFLPANTVDEAEAATLAWTGVNIPSTVNNVLVANAEDLGPVAISPNYANDSTVFATINNQSVTPTVYFSTNAGHTWVPTVSTLGVTGDVGVALVISPDFANDSTLFVAIQDPDAGGSGQGIVYRSTNGGISFGQMGNVTLSGNEVITSMDVSPDYDGVGVIVIGVADRYLTTVAASARCLQVWGSDDVLSWTAIDPGTNYDVSAVKFSPSYPIDATILTVASAGFLDEPYLRPVVGGVWSSSLATLVGAAGIDDFAQGEPNEANGLHYASIAVPSDYNSTESTLMRAYVSIASVDAVATDNSNVYRITGTTTGTEIATDMGERLYPLDYSGTFSEGTLIGGLYSITTGQQADVYRTTNPTSAVVDWYAVTGTVNKPTGALGTVTLATDNTTVAYVTGWVMMSPDFADDSTVIVGTQGSDSAFGVSTDGAVSFNETGLIENNDSNLASLVDLALSPTYSTDETIFLVSDADTASSVDTNVWVTTNGGLYWDRCLLETWTTDGVIALSNEFTTDSVLYVGDQSGTEVYYSGNAGKTWSARAVASATGVEIQTMAAPDATTLYVGSDDDGNVAKSINSGWTWPSAFVSDSGASTAVINLKVDESTVLVGGSVGTVRRSDDGGATWTLVGGAAPGGSNPLYVDFDDTYVWAAEGTTGNVYRSEDGDAWLEIASTSTGALAVELILATDGTLYMADPTVTANLQVYRSIDPDATLPRPDATFQAMTGLTAVAVDALSVASGSGNTVAVVEGTNDTLQMYSDTLSAAAAAPDLVYPADGAVLTGTTSTIMAYFTVEFPVNATQVNVWYATNADFINAVTSSEIDAPDDMVAVNLVAYEGLTIYWMARASLPLNGAWSETWTVQVPAVTTVAAPIPQYPAGDDVMDIQLKPMLNWSAFKYATGYQVQLSTSSDMSSPMIDETLGNTNSYKVASPLDYDSTYYWRVRALIGTAASYSDWSAIIGFTTMSKPVAPTPPVIIEPTPPAPVLPTPETPAYIWGIIAIGAVLVIVVIVLIVRTRRTP